MSQRFFVENPIADPLVTLGGAEAHHLLHVMRARVDDQITLFDGSGYEFAARVEQLKRSEVRVEILDKQEVCREAVREIVVGVALPKGDRQRWLIEKLTELGAAQVVPLSTSRSGVHPDARSLQKLRRFVIEASKQCGRNRLMQIDPLTDLDQFLTTSPDSATRWFADPTSQSSVERATSDAPVYLAVGPEGGFTSEECAAASAAGWRTVSLGPRILRIETACTALVAVLN